jgi:hemerythrin-like metal-binding protein
MAYVTWDPSLETGNDVVDQEHRGLYDLLNELYDSIVESSGVEAQGEVLARMADYAVVHFADEEALMRSIGYPGLGEQQKMHHDFVAEVGRMSDEWRSGGTLLPLTVAMFLRQWLQEHIGTEDKKIGDFIRANRS